MKPCPVENCIKNIVRRGSMCSMHYNRVYRHGSLDDLRDYHGLSGTELHRKWAAMKRRCYNPNTRQYKWYGRKGIEVCEEWQTFKPFHVWAISSGWKPGLTIDRIDNDGNYCPENCQWLTLSENVSKMRKEL